MLKRYVFRLFILASLLVLSGCATTVKPNWSDAAADGGLVVITAIHDLPVYNYAGTTIVEQKPETVFGPDWDIPVRFNTQLRQQIRTEVNDWVKEDPEHFSRLFQYGFNRRLSLTDAGKRYFREFQDQSVARIIAVFPAQDAPLYHTGISDHSHGFVYNCVLFVACYARPFVNLDVAYIDISAEPRITANFSERHPDIPDDYIKGFTTEAFEREPAETWKAVRPFINKYIDGLAVTIGEGVSPQQKR